MTITELEVLLPKFKTLLGTYSEMYQGTVSRIFVGFTNADLTYLTLISPISQSIHGVQKFTHDTFTLLIWLDNFKLIGLREYVENQKIKDLTLLVQSLPYADTLTILHNEE